jgi:16S rRNA (cytosine1402-N4)-methyltransferase
MKGASPGEEEAPWQKMHEPVLVREVLQLLDVRRGGTYIDGTMGSGGHTLALLDAIGPGGRLLGIDRDEAAVLRTRARIAEQGAQWSRDVGDVCTFVRGNFADIALLARDAGFSGADGILTDLGVSSEQLEAAERGFSFMHDGPLDMRMDRTQPETAADLVNGLGQVDLQSIIREYGEERHARRIAAAIVKARRDKPIEGTEHLAEVISRTVGRRGRIHPATRTFMALRIAVNKELQSLSQGLDGAVDVLKEGGRLAVISFHSLEDRIVKRFFREHAGRWVSLPAGGREWNGTRPCMKLVNRRPVCPTEEERERNARSRSAKLRVAERVCRPEGSVA